MTVRDTRGESTAGETPEDVARLETGEGRKGLLGRAAIPRPIAVVSLGVFLNRIGGFFSIFLTLVLADRGYGPREITVGLALVAVSGMAGAGLSGLIADRIGRRSTLLLSTGLTALFSLALVQVAGYWGTLVLACLMGAVVQAYGPVAQAVVGEAAPADRRVALFAFYRMALNIGAAIGPLVGGFWAASNMGSLLVGNAVVSAAAALMLLLGLPRDMPQRGTRGKKRTATVAAPGAGVFSDLRFVGVSVLLGVVALVYAQQTGPLPLAMKDSGFSTSAFGALLTMNAIVVISCEVPLAMLIGKLPTRIPVTLGAVCVFGGFFVYALGVSWPFLIGGVLLWTVGEMLISPVAAAAATDAAPEGAGARYQSFLGFCQSTGMSLGPAFGVLLYGIGPLWPWLVSGAVGCVVAPLVFRLLTVRGVRR
ncbi:MFS transporter [Streptomyces apocyni]|uniref:MFS transporter n=1 Tax=Streptomyces apocyni TaxID=2654677 RepID=UPI0018D0763D|nr:MFS transporter [Streptomyces apocyni]